MKASDLIARLQSIVAEKGDLDVMTHTDDGSVYSLWGPNVVEVEEDDYPEDWNMPKGFTYIELGFDT